MKKAKARFDIVGRQEIAPWVSAQSKSGINSMTYHLPIIIEACEEGGFFGECPALQGCHVEGETFEETVAELHAVINAVVEDMKAIGEELPVRFPLLSVYSVEL